MKKAKIETCPFCGSRPSGKRFCSTDRGPALECDRCGCMGPAALDKEFVGHDEDKLNPQAIERWNFRAFHSGYYRMGIQAAASFVEQFDKYVSHPSLLSDCILAKFNLLGKGKIRKNDQRLVRAFSAAIRYFQICFEGGTKVGHPDRVRAGKDFNRAMKEFCSYVDRRTPARRKGERRIPGGPEFILGSLLSQERRQHVRREGARRRRS
jgi:hypothetical protein